MPKGLARPVALLASLLLLTALPAPWQELLEYRREAILAGEVWRLWTGHLVHFGLAHALIDVSALGALLWLASRLDTAMRCLPGLLLAMPGISLGFLLLEPALGVYRGLSAIDMTLLACLLGVAWRQRPGSRLVLAVVAAMALAKSLADIWGLVPTMLTEDVRVAASAHLLGLIAGSAILWRFRIADTRPGFV